MSSVTIQNVTKTFGNTTVLENFDAVFADGEFITLLGPSGCGKTTMLRIIAGFEKPTSGSVLFDDRVVSSDKVFIPPEKRDIGMVFQSYAVWPHMTVFDNVAYPLQIKKVDKAAIRQKVEHVLEVVHLAQYRDRIPSQLSGGQQQRVALARAIVIEPDVLLMDEPLSNLDAKLRVEMRNVIKRIQRQIGITTVYVTHDQEEALAISDRIAVMHDGVIQQIDSPKRLYQRPANIFVSTFIGLSNIIAANVSGGMVDFGHGYQVEGMYLRDDAREAGEVKVAVRPEEFIIADKTQTGIPATVKSSVFLGVNMHYFLEDAAGNEIEVMTPSDLSEIIPDETEVRLQVVKEKINIFDAETQSSLIREGV